MNASENARTGAVAHHTVVNDLFGLSHFDARTFAGSTVHVACGFVDVHGDLMVAVPTVAWLLLSHPVA